MIFKGVDLTCDDLENEIAFVLDFILDVIMLE